MDRIITIGREYGAGGHTIGQRVAQELGIPFYDRDIVRQTAAESGYTQEVVETEGEDITRAGSILRGIVASSVWYSDSQDAIHDVQSAVILRFAREGPCVILGRCADAVLRGAGVPSLNVFIHAGDVHRAVRISALTGSKDGAEIQRLMAKKDASRRAYYARYTGRKWGDGRNYDLTLDSGSLGYELCAKLIVEAAAASDEAPR